MKEYAKIDVTEIIDGYEIDYEVFIKHPVGRIDIAFLDAVLSYSRDYQTEEKVKRILDCHNDRIEESELVDEDAIRIAEDLMVIYSQHKPWPIIAVELRGDTSWVKAYNYRRVTKKQFKQWSKLEAI